jgi:hypothetical protein
MPKPLSFRALFQAIYRRPNKKVTKPPAKIMLSMKNSTKIRLAKTNKPKKEKTIAKLKGENGFIITKAMVLAINIKKTIGLKMKKAISATAILFGRESLPLKRSFKHLTHKQIS